MRSGRPRISTAAIITIKPPILQRSIGRSGRKGRGKKKTALRESMMILMRKWSDRRAMFYIT
jgi:hypothetical protein